MMTPESASGLPAEFVGRCERCGLETMKVSETTIFCAHCGWKKIVNVRGKE